MGKPLPTHQCAIFASPWPGVYGTVTESARHFGRHSHATYGFGVMEQGAQHSASGRGAVRAFAGDVMTTNPGEVHDGRPYGVGLRRWRMLHLPAEILAGFTGVSYAVAITRPVMRDPALARAAHDAIFLLERWSTGEASALECEEAVVEACCQLLDRHGTCVPEHDGAAIDLRRVREQVLDDLLAEPTLAQLAAAAGLGRFQLLRRFRGVYGLTPHGLLQQQRAERARNLIAGGRGLAAAAAESGFADQSHMTHAFGRQFGFTPGAWQRTTWGR